MLFGKWIELTNQGKHYLITWTIQWKVIFPDFANKSIRIQDNKFSCTNFFFCWNPSDANKSVRDSAPHSESSQFHWDHHHNHNNHHHNNFINLLFKDVTSYLTNKSRVGKSKSLKHPLLHDLIRSLLFNESRLYNIHWRLFTSTTLYSNFEQ